MVFVTFKKQNGARTGNCIFQYLTCKLFSLLQGHTYIPLESFVGTDPIIITDKNFIEMLKNPEIKTKDLYCDGFFQISEPFIQNRSALLASLQDCKDIWYEGSVVKTIAEFLCTPSPVKIGPRDVVLSLRLDDFIQLPCPTSDIISPTFYTNILETMFFEKLYIVCDRLRHNWEHKYLEYFAKWSPIMIQGTLLSDAAMMRESHTLLHSNSTLCWIMSYLASEPKQRIIPRTYFYRGQNLDKIEISDKVIRTSPLPHSSVYALNVESLDVHNYLPLPYAIPDKYILSEMPVKNVRDADMPVGTRSSHRFGAGQENEYLEIYKNAYFAKTCKKGGWDCLRHYEILANGTIPEFADLESAPIKTMISFPKDLVINANNELKSHKDNVELCKKWGEILLEYTNMNLSTTTLAHYFLSKFPHKINKILLLTGHPGPNYSREFLTIGLSQVVEKLSCFPPLPFLFKGNDVDKSALHGNGYCYTDHLEPQTDLLDDVSIIKSIECGEWDLILFGKVGPDEGLDGHCTRSPFWDLIKSKYNKDKIAFIYGGDEQFNISTNNRYKAHLAEHSRFGRCFIRELNS